MKNVSPRIVLCNAANLPESLKFTLSISLEYREDATSNPNIKLGLPEFVGSVYHLPNRVLDLLEIAAYVYCSDRLVSRGSRDSVEYHSWSRLFEFVTKVRDYEFWNTPDVIDILKQALTFMSGDRDYNFTFQPGHLTHPTGLFDNKQFQIIPKQNPKVILFSGGLDSLVGIVDCLENSTDQLFLVSHRSGQPRTSKTQDQLIKVLKERFPNRIEHYKFHCNLRKITRIEETQRTRIFLYTSIAYALAHAVSANEIYVYENGITSINFPKHQDQMNARASRTTHPKTITLLENLYSKVNQSKIRIVNPFLWKTKTDILNKLEQLGHKDLISSSVSCSHTSQTLRSTTHCGGCSQCIDRRFAAYGAELDNVDEAGIYASDFILGENKDNELFTTLINYVIQARNFAEWNYKSFSLEMVSELVDLIDYIPGSDEDDKVKKIWNLCRKHGKQVETASLRMREIHDTNLYNNLPQNSFLELIAKRKYLNESKQQGRINQTMDKNNLLNGMKIFYSYSHKDEQLREQLQTHLMILRREGIISEWHFRKISPGREWEDEIDKNLNSANVILLLISPDFIASDYCYDVEMKRAMERHEAGEARVIPIILRPVLWKEATFGKLNGLPTNVKPVTTWDNQDEAFLDIAEGIKKVIEELDQTETDR